MDLNPPPPSPSPPAPENPPDSDPVIPDVVPLGPRHRTANACAKCRERKTKCSGDKPVCERCANRGLICQYNATRGEQRSVKRAASLEALRGSIPTNEVASGNSGCSLLPVPQPHQPSPLSQAHLLAIPHPQEVTSASQPQTQPRSLSGPPAQWPYRRHPRQTDFGIHLIEKQPYSLHEASATQASFAYQSHLQYANELRRVKSLGVIPTDGTSEGSPSLAGEISSNCQQHHLPNWGSSSAFLRNASSRAPNHPSWWNDVRNNGTGTEYHAPNPIHPPYHPNFGTMYHHRLDSGSTASESNSPQSPVFNLGPSFAPGATQASFGAFNSFQTTYSSSALGSAVYSVNEPGKYASFQWLDQSLPESLNRFALGKSDD